MQVSLDPDIELSVNQLVASGKSSPDAVVNTALRLFLDPAKLQHRHEELKGLIREGVESEERGELYDADEVFEEILRDLDNRAQGT